MPQTLLLFALPADMTMYPWQLREAVARKQPKQAEVLFHARDGKPAPGHPPIRFIGWSRRVGIVADDGYEGVLYENMALVTNAVAHHCGRAVPVTLETHECRGLVRDSRMRTFVARNIAIRRDQGASQDAAVAEKIGRAAILSGLVSINQQYGDGCLPPTPPSHSAEVWREHLEAVADTLDIQFQLQREPRLSSLIVTKDGKTARANQDLLLISMLFTLSADIVGIHGVGSLKSRGYGLIRHARLAPPEKVAA